MTTVTEPHRHRRPIAPDPARTTLVRPHGADDAPTYRIAESRMSVLACREETGGVFGLVELSIPPQGGPPPHIHGREDEIFYILEGTITFRLARGVIEAAPGTFVYSPKGTQHAWRNESDTTARMLCGFLPGGFEGYFADVAQPAGAPPMTPGDYIAWAMAVSPRYEIDYRIPGATAPEDIWSGLRPEDDRNTVRLPGAGETVWSPQQRTTVKVDHAASQGRLAVWEKIVAPGGSVPPRLHRNEDEALYVLEGELTWTLPDGTEARLSTGGFVYSPRHTPYAWRNEGTENARLLAIATPWTEERILVAAPR